jgi:uncharacterized protein (TIGR01244 family)
MIRLDQQASVRGQVQPQEVSNLAAEGITVLVNNRPDGEEPDQPHAHEIEEAAAAAGIAYHHIPITRGIGPAEVAAMRQALEEAEGGQLLAFCRSGNRSALTLALAKRERGETAEDVQQCLSDAGFDAGPIAHLL